MLVNIQHVLTNIQDLSIQIEVTNVLTSMIDIVVDAENKALVVDLTTELQLLLQEQCATAKTLEQLKDERRTYMEEASSLRDQLVMDYRNMLGQMDESRRQLAERPKVVVMSTPSSALSTSSPPPPPPYNAELRGEPSHAALPPDMALRRLMLAPFQNPGRIVKKILSYFDASDIYALSDASGFYTHLINWIFEELPTPPPLMDVRRPRTLQITPPPPFTPGQQAAPLSSPPPPPYTPTAAQQQQRQQQQQQQRQQSKRSANRLKKADTLSKSLSRRELKEIRKLGARCKSLEKQVMILQNEKDDLTSQADAAGNVKQFLLDKVKTLEGKVQHLQSQTDNDQQIISFLDSSIEKKEQEKNEWMIERDAYKMEKFKWSEDKIVQESKTQEMLKTLEQLKSQKKVLVQEVKRMRKEKRASNSSSNTSSSNGDGR